MSSSYVHGYSSKENNRLQDQAHTLVDLLHSDSTFPDGCSVLEVGCGVGAQTITIARQNPLAKFTAIEISKNSITEAKKTIQSSGLNNVEFIQCNIFNMPLREYSFDHIFVCFVLEHLPNPVETLLLLKKYLKTDGQITLIEGDHGSTFFYPDSREAKNAIDCQVELQKRSGGNANIGRELFPLLLNAGYKNIFVSPRMVYVDASHPGLVDGFTRKTFTAMIEGVKEKSIQENLIDEVTFDKGISDLYRTTESDGVFCYTFFKASAQI